MTDTNDTEAKLAQLQNEMTDAPSDRRSTVKDESERGHSDVLTETLIDAGSNRSTTVTTRSNELWALVATVEDNNDLRAQLYNDLNVPLDDDQETISRSALIERLALLGLREHSESIYEDLMTARSASLDPLRD